ncbi:hypothetical protein CURTO8I2_80002 [Curtobacterium sp. 8I-2]|nr:hypothetical protein CURTO8I2_80002 [Curtobacterium sp. 8I-2]
MPPDLSVGGHFLLCLPGECRHRCAQGVLRAHLPNPCEVPRSVRRCKRAPNTQHRTRS